MKNDRLLTNQSAKLGRETISQPADVSSSPSGLQPNHRTAADSGGLEHHDNITKFARLAKLNGRAPEAIRENGRARFLAKTALAPSGCLEWTGALQSRGYGSFGLSGHTVLAHRYAWELERGPIPEPLTIDHLCRNKRCVNVAHLELVTVEENAARVRRAAVTCLKGHPIAFSSVQSGQRRCSICRELHRAREAFERMCRRRGLEPQRFTTAAEYRAALADLKARKAVAA